MYEDSNTKIIDSNRDSSVNVENNVTDAKVDFTTSDDDAFNDHSNNTDEQATDDNEEKVGSETVSCSSAASDCNLDDDDQSEMPLLKYARIVGSLPRSFIGDERGTSTKSSKPLSPRCKCSVMGRVTITPSQLNESFASSKAALNKILSDSSRHETPMGSSDSSRVHEEMMILQSTKSQTFSILAMVTEDESIHLVDPRTGMHICSPSLLTVHSHASSQKSNIVSLSFDSSGTYLGAVTEDGDVAIFELRFGIATKCGEIGNKNNNTGGQDKASGSLSWKNAEKRSELFDSFLSRLAGEDRISTSASTSTHISSKESAIIENNELSSDEEYRLLPIPCLKLTHPVSTARFSIRSSNTKSQKATCISIDPAYKRKREKGVLVGFSNGFLIYTRRNGHGGTVADSSNFGGVVGSLLQPKRHDLDLYQGTGQGGSKYIGIEAITWRGALVSWADASGIKIFDIDKMTRIAHVDRPSGARASLYHGLSSLRPSLLFEKSDSLLIGWGDCLMNMAIQSRINTDKFANSVKTIKRTVKCTMAWQLDCVACGIVPMDSDHVAVLGLVPTSSLEVELQVISRTNGTVVQSDVLPLLNSDKNLDGKLSTFDFNLSSSFSTPRMEDSYEAEEEELSNDEAVDFDIHKMMNGDLTSSFISASSPQKFTDSHMKWNISAYKDVICSEVHDDENSSIGSGNSEYSDDYNFLFRDMPINQGSKSLLWNAPTLVITSKYDAVLVQTRDVDDSIEHAKLAGDHALALRRGLDHRQILRRYDLNMLIDEYFSAIFFHFDHENMALLTIRRLTIAAKATEILFGGNINMWEKWVTNFAKIPGAIFLLWPYIPTRDPKLSSKLYENCLLQMFDEIKNMFNGKNCNGASQEVQKQIQDDAMDLFLEALRAWGPYSSLKDRLKLHRLTIHDENKEMRAQSRLYSEAELALTRRMKQSADKYLQCNPIEIGDQPDDYAQSTNIPSGVTFDSLFHLDSFLASFQPKFYESLEDSEKNRSNLLFIEVFAETSFMKGSYKESLNYFLDLSSSRDQSISQIEDEAIASLTGSNPDSHTLLSNDRYKHILTMIETHDLHRVLLKKRSGPSHQVNALPPLISLILLVGLENSGNFIIQHSTLPRSAKAPVAIANDERAGLPINHIAAQLNGYPKLLFWFLQRIFFEKPEVYVQFPTTAVPSSSVMDLHRVHFNLHVDLADRSFDEKKKLTTIPTFDEQRYESPLLQFLKIALPLGGIRSDDVMNTLEKCRKLSEDDNIIIFPHLFAHELAFVIERSGSGSEEDARKVLNLYLEGVVSLPLAVEFIQRNTSFTSLLWEALVTYCLNDEREDEGLRNSNDVKEGGVNGELFGSLLEVAARSGADLAHLVSKIPKGMSIHGIRSKLVTAISDYRFKLKINEDAVRIFSDDKIALLREQYHRARRAVRIDLSHRDEC